MRPATNIRAVISGRLPAFVPAVALAVTTIAAGIALLGISGWFLTGAALTTAAVSFNLFGPSSVIRGLSLLRVLSRYGERLSGHDATIQLLVTMREWLFVRLAPLGPFDPAQWQRGDLVSRLTADLDALDALVLTAIGPAVTTLVAAAGLSILLAVYLPAAMPVFITGFLTASFLIPSILVLGNARAARRSMQAAAALRTHVIESIAGHADLLAFDAVADAERQFFTASDVIATEERRQTCGTAIAGAAAQITTGAGALGVLWIGLQAVHAARISGPALAGVFLAVLAGFETAATLMRGAGRFGAALAAGQRLEDLVRSKPKIADVPAPRALPPGSDLVLNNVTVSRRPERPILRDLSLFVGTSERVAIFGESGAGKSTLFDVILRLIEPEAGTARMAGVDIRHVAQAEVHRRVSLLSQDTTVFLGTVRENLAIGGPEASEAELWIALRKARLESTIAALPLGLDTWLGEGGLNLSGGESRRLCLARTLLSPATILLLDEPTSGLDHDTAQAFLNDLPTATAGRTVLLATHAELPPGAVDHAYRLQDGRLTRLL